MGKVITTHLVDGNPRGIRSVFISNKICNMYVIPRQQINEANANPDILLEQPAFYILLGGDDDFASNPQAYIGQTENFKERVRSHEAKKEFWNTALVFIAKDNSLNKADVQFIEAKAIRTAKKVQSYLLTENKSIPTPPNLPPHLRDAVSEFIEDIELLTAFVGCTIFFDSSPKTTVDEDEVFYFKRRGGEGRTTYKNGVMTLLAGSIIELTSAPSFRGKSRRDEMIAKLTHEENGKRVLAVNREFTSPSMAAMFVCGVSTNGPESWKNARGETLKAVRAKS